MKAKAPGGTLELKPVNLELNATCRRCGQECDLWKSQRVSTKQAIFVCSKCNTKGVQLSRLFGSWPPKMFKCMSEDEQKKFWDGIKDTPSPQLEGVVVQKLSIVRKEWEEAKEGGTTSLSVSTRSVASMWMPSPPAARTSMRILSWAPATECASALSSAAQSRP